MNRRTFNQILATATAAIAAPAVSLRPAAAQEVTLKVAHFWPPIATPQQKLLVPWTEKLTRESGGRLKFQFLPAMQSGGTPAQLIDQAQDGVVDIVWTLPGYTPGRFPIVEVFELPLLGTYAEGCSRALWEFYASTKVLQDEFKAVKPLAFHTTDKYVIHTVKRPVLTTADFAGLKLRAATRYTNKVISALGATPVSMPLSTVPDALSKGTIDGCIIPWEAAPSIKLHEICKFHSETPLGSPSIALGVFTIAMNSARYAALEPDLRQIIDANSGASLSQQIGKLWDDVGGAARELARGAGNSIQTIAPVEIANWEKRLITIQDDWKKDVTAKGADGAALLSQVRAQIAQFSKAL